MTTACLEFLNLASFSVISLQVGRFRSLSFSVFPANDLAETALADIEWFGVRSKLGILVVD